MERDAPPNGGPPGGRAVKGKSLREQVVESLRWSIFIGELQPGHQFSVPALAEQFGVSPTPVREAVLDLAQQGLVIALANKGFQVVSPSTEYIQQAMRVRRLLEVPAMADIARSVEPEQLGPARDLAEATMRAAEQADIRTFVENDYAFHWQLTSLCGNGVLTSMIEELRSRARVVVIPVISRLESLVVIAQEHLDLVDAIAARDIAEVERLTIAHMDRTHEGIRHALEQRA